MRSIWTASISVLTNSGFDGHKYLDKIVQISYGIPDAGRDRLLQLLLGEIEKVVDLIHNPVGTSDLADIIQLIVAPMVTTVRDIKRYANVLPFALALLGEEIALSDILALEAVRLFLPLLYEKLLSTASISRLPRLDIMPMGAKFWATLIKDLQEAAGPYALVVTELIRGWCFRLAKPRTLGSLSMRMHTPLSEGITASPRLSGFGSTSRRPYRLMLSQLLSCRNASGRCRSLGRSLS